jgi:hypothetical protein
MSILLSLSKGHPDSVQAFATKSNLKWTRDMLESTSSSFIEFACNILGNIARHQSLANSVVQLEPCQRIVSLVEYDYLRLSIVDPDLASCRHAEPNVAMAAAETLSQLCRVDAGIYDFSNIILELLGSADDAVVKSGCQLLGRLARVEHMSPAIANSSCCQYLVSLIG